MVRMSAALLHNEASGVARRPLGAGPSKQLPGTTALKVQQLSLPTPPNVKSSFE